LYTTLNNESIPDREKLTILNSNPNTTLYLSRVAYLKGIINENISFAEDESNLEYTASALEDNLDLHYAADINTCRNDYVFCQFYHEYCYEEPISDNSVTSYCNGNYINCIRDVNHNLGFTLAEDYAPGLVTTFDFYATR